MYKGMKFHLMNTQQYGIENEARTAVEIWFEKLEQPLILAKNSSYKFSNPRRMIYFTTALFSKKYPHEIAAESSNQVNRHGYLTRITSKK